MRPEHEKENIDNWKNSSNILLALCSNNKSFLQGVSPSVFLAYQLLNGVDFFAPPKQKKFGLLEESVQYTPKNNYCTKPQSPKNQTQNNVRKPQKTATHLSKARFF